MKRLDRLTLALLTLLPLILVGCGSSKNIDSLGLREKLQKAAMKPSPGHPSEVIVNTLSPQVKLSTYEEYENWCNTIDVSQDALSDTERDVPQYFISHSPVNEIKASEKKGKWGKKNLLACVFLPHIHYINKQIEADRTTTTDLLNILDANESLSTEEKTWLLYQGLEYRLINGDKNDIKFYTRKERQESNLAKAKTLDFDKYAAKLKRLPYRINTIPPAMVLGQVAVESGWGLSPYIQKGNNPLGLRGGAPYDAPRCMGAKENNKVCMIKFENLHEALWEYFNRYNAHGKDSQRGGLVGTLYDSFRFIRESASLGHSSCVTSKDILLQGGTGPYSTTPNYGVKVNNIISRDSKIIKFDGLLFNDYLCH